MSSVEPDIGTDEEDSPEEVSGGFVVSCGYGSELFDFLKEILDQMTGFIKFLVIFALVFAVLFRRNNALNVHRRKFL